MHEESYAAAVAVPEELAVGIQWTHNSDPTSSALIRQLGVMCAYRAEYGKCEYEFERNIMMIRKEQRELRDAGTKF